jgi:outer membrane receptor protein involved in Fe transport
MFDRSVQEAARAVNDDYGNYSAHLFLANSYDALRDPKLINLRYETPWFSELLVADLLMPVNGGNLSQNISQQEYSKLFASDGLGFFSRTEYSSRGNWQQNASQYGVFGNSSYSLDAFYLGENGYRPNNDLEQINLSARFKQQITDKDSVFLQIGYFNSDSGDVAQYYYQTNADHTFRAKERQEPNLLAGYHREWSPGNHTLFLFSWFDDTLITWSGQANPLAHTYYVFTDPLGNPLGTNDFVSALNNTRLNYNSKLEAYSGELQQIFEKGPHTLILGGRYQAGWSETSTHLLRPAIPPPPIGTPIDVNQNLDSELDRLSVYGYEQWQALDSLRLIGGVSYDHLHFPRNIDTSPITSEKDGDDRVSPKAGFLWSPLDDTHFRGAYTRSLGGVFFDQSVRLEPVQIAGFNDAFRSLIPESVAGLAPGTRFETWGLGWDQRIAPTRTYMLVQGEVLQSWVSRSLGLLTNEPAVFPPVPNRPSSTRQSLDFQESSLTVALNQLLGDEWAVGGRYKITYADLDAGSSIPSSTAGSSALRPDISAKLEQLDLYAIYQHPCGFFAQVDGIWSDQVNYGYSPSLPETDFWQFNFYAGYRFLQRRAEARLGVLNIGDSDYHLNPLTLYNELPRGRVFTVSLKLNF